jgi:dCTP deaminase
MTAVLGERDIIREREAGRLVIYDPDRDVTGNVQNCSVDVTLGPNYYEMQEPLPFFNPWNAGHVHRHWGSPLVAKTVTTEEEEKAVALPLGSQYILLAPGATILGHTREFIGGKEGITTMMKARSSMGRSNVTVCRDAGWGDIGYINRWTMEITNAGHSPVVLPVGARVAQIVFFYAGPTTNPYQGKYQNSDCLTQLVENWSPTGMLPRLSLDQ